MYQKELNALKKSGRFRERKLCDENLIDLASNDYLGLAHNKEQFNKAVELIQQYDCFAPKSSMLVGGYHRVHKMFEDEISALNGFESAITVGSGFLANMALLESLVRKGDFLLIDEEYHASGMVVLPGIEDRYAKFIHNNSDDLRSKLIDIKSRLNPKRIIIAIEGIYSMSGDICAKEIFDIADEFGAILIVDEAHSSGTIGGNLLGVFDYYNIAPKLNHIKMGTLGKAYGSYGAYILASKHIISFLENRAKPIIYSTAPSLFDIALGLVNMRYIQENRKNLKAEINARLELAQNLLGKKIYSLILPIKVASNIEALKHQETLKIAGYFVGAIRQPTVKEPILRVIMRVSVPIEKTKDVILKIKEPKSQSI
jgi:8-amino-7-oxononanoate synthase